MECIYSLNLAAWLQWQTGYKPTIERDEDNYKMYFCTFPHNEVVSDSISQYKNYEKVLVCEDLREYLKIFKELKREIKNMKNSYRQHSI